MNNRLSWIIGLSATALLAAEGQARAQTAEACNNVEVSGDEQCTVLVENECTTQCEPASFVLACDGQCEGVCTETATQSCVEECDTTCVEECEVDPGSFSCTLTCSSDCESACSVECQASEDAAGCQAECAASCESECEASCELVPPEATCETVCATCCETSCTVSRNALCKVDCEAECAGELETTCTTRCEQSDGQVFCDGQYIDAGEEIEECIDYLGSLDIDVDGWARGDAECLDNDECRIEAAAGCSCGQGPSAPAAGAAALMAGLAFFLLRPRRRPGL